MLALLLASSAVAQPTAWAWSTSHDNGTNEYVAAVATAPDGLHHYVAGTYDFWALLGNGPFGLPNTQGLTGSSDGFLVKLDQNGDVVWRNRIGGTGTDYVTGMTVGPDGNIYVTGAFSGSFSLLGFLGLSQSLSSSGGTDMFVACFSPYGDLIWMQKGGGAQNDEGYSVAVDATGVYVHGTYRTTATFGTSTLTSGNNTRNAFLVKFPLNGDAPLWVYKGEASSSENVEPGGIVAGEGRIFVIGNFNSDQFRWRSATNTQLASVSTTGTVGNVYVSAFDQSGSTAWLRAIDDPGDNNRSTAIDLSCRKLYIGGRCHQNAVFPGSVAMQHTSAHDFMYVAVLNASSGSTQRVWTARGSSNHQAEVRTIKASENGHVHFTAWFRGTLQTMEGVQYTATNGTDMVVGRLDREGRLQWLRHDGAQGDELPYALDVDQSNRLFVAGAYTDRLSQPPYTHAASTNLNIFHSALDDPAPSVDPSRWKPVQAVCATAGLIDLNERIRGYADATRSTSGVLQATDMIGAPDGAGALFSTTTANVIIDLGDTVPAGYPISFLWAATTAAAVNARIEYATTVGSWTTHPGTLNRNSLSYGTSSIHLNAPARFIRISRSTAPSSGPFRIDAVSFYTSTLPGGTWTGPNVNATGQFDPAGFSGHVNITYTVNDGSCSYTTTRTMLVTPPASALLSGTTDVCPGPLPVTVELSDLSAYTDLEDWEYTTNGMDWDGLGTDDQLLYFPDGISETTWFRAVLRSSGCGQAYSMEHRVQVGDTLPPIILNCPADTVLHLPVSSCTSPFVWPTVLSTDNCGTSAFTAGTLVLHYSDPFAQQSIDVTNAPMFNMPAGVHQLTESFSDDSGNTSTCSYTITVIDSIAPTIECPRDLFLEVDANTCGRVVSYPTPIFSDNCPGATITLLQGPASGSFFPVGSTRITHRVTDNSGNERMCSFWVTIIDTQAPTLANCTDIVVDIDPNTCGAAVTFSAPLFDDNCGPCSVAALPAGTIHLGEYQGRSYHLATTPHNWSSANNAAIAAGGHLAVIRNATHNTWLRNAVSVASPTAVGNERAYWVGLSDAAVEGSFRWINGTPATYLNWSVNEPSNTNGGEHYVEVLSSGEWNDLRMESLRRYVIEIEPSCSQVVQFSGPASGSVFPVGDTEVSFKVVDATGNASTCSFTVTVWDNTACGCANPAPGSACDDGDSATVNDLIQADCSCVGTLLDCAGVPDGDAVLDNCGTCVGGSTGLIACDQDCNNVWGGTASIDACGVCSGGNTGIAINSTCLDCNGDVNGTASIDACGVCSGGNTGIAINSTCLDCNGDVNGTASIDACGVCSGGNTGIAINSTCLDCNGDVNGTASIDACGVCSGGNTGISPNSTCLDCNGDVNGTASIDACGVCSGGNTGIAINSTCLDCNGDVNGTALPGTPCNDQNAATVNDTWDQNCNCVGVPINCSSYAGPDQVVCGNTTQLNASGFGIWEYPSGLNITDPSNAQSSVTANVLGTYDLFWVVEDGPCIAIDTVSVTFLPIPDASFQYAASVLCSASQPETPWVAMSGGVFTSNPTTLALDPFTGIIDAAASVPGTYEVTHSIAGTCPSNSSTTVVIVGSMDAAWNAPSSICSNDTPIQLASTVIGDQGGTWSGTGVTNSIFNPSGLAGAIELTYTVGTAPCAASQTHTITVNGAPSANAGPDLTTCGASISMQATAGNGHSTWSIPNGLSVVGALGDPNITIEADAPGSYTLSWTVTNGLCTATDQVTVTFLPMNSELWVEAGPDQYLAMVDNTVLIGSASPGASVTWSISSGAGHFTSPHSLQTTLHGLTPGQHTVILHANQGPCASASDTLIIHIADLFIPEGFSPNGDGVNDLYEITGIMALPGSRLTVFNRWGQEVYQSSDYRNEWDGRSAGRALPDDTYFYVLNLSNDRSYNGHIILKR
ncbi:MAG: HYR domain-containing protein [Flavobacteriales bacterium]|nr:HYR domain-containing protein [Flavobacteriales bacterium]